MSYRRRTVTAVSFPSVDVKKEDAFWQWYRQTLEKSGMIDQNSPVTGSFVLKPTSCALWERIRSFLDDRLKGMGVRDCAFPLLASGSTASSDENPGYAEAELEVKLRNTPSTTSDLHPYYARWITSHRDLPLRLNQWKTAFRWEPCPQPFLRCREFFVQEAHTAHLTQNDAKEEIQQVLDIYAALYEEQLAVPVVRGYRSENRSTVSATNTPDVDEGSAAIVVGNIPALGQCIQGGICRELGQRFSKQYGITVHDPSAVDHAESDAEPLVHVWQNSWRFSIRAIGLMVATHGDDRGLVLPPHIAENQVAIIPLQSSLNEQDHQKIHDEINSIQSTLSSLGVRAAADLRSWCSPGWKLEEWMTRGVPLRLSLGSEELAGQYVTVYRRDLPRPEGKSTVPISDLRTTIPALLETIHKHLFQKACDAFHSRQKQVTDWTEFVHALESEESASICLAPHCRTKDCEDQVEDLRTGAARKDTMESSSVKCICIPWDQRGGIQESTRCINPDCGYSAKKWAMFGYEY